MKPRAVLSEDLSWASCIGNFLLNFGTLDTLVFVFLKDRLEGEEIEKIRKWHFKNRLDRVGKFLQDAGWGEKDRSAAFGRWSWARVGKPTLHGGGMALSGWASAQIANLRYVLGHWGRGAAVGRWSWAGPEAPGVPGAQTLQGGRLGLRC